MCLQEVIQTSCNHLAHSPSVPVHHCSPVALLTPSPNTLIPVWCSYFCYTAHVHGLGGPLTVSGYWSNTAITICGKITCFSRRCFTLYPTKIKKNHCTFFKQTNKNKQCSDTDRSSWSRVRVGALPSVESCLQWERLTRRGRLRGSCWRKKEPNSRKHLLG